MKHTIRLFVLTLIAFSATARLAQAQGLVTEEYFRQLGMPDQVATVAPPAADDEQKYNFAVGPLRFNVAAGVGFEFNDNVTLKDSGKESDFIFRPSLTLDGYWTLSELNTLRFSLGVSYAKYLEHSEFDTRGILLSPSSALAFSIHVGNFIITLRDQFSYQEDPLDNPVLSGVAIYRRFENTAGIQVDWPLSDTIRATFGYNHYNLFTFQQVFKQLDRSVDSVYIKPSVAISPSVTVGVDASASWVKFSAPIQNDGRNYLVGPFVEVNFSEATKAYVEAGYQLFEFDRPSGKGGVTDSRDSSSWYGRAEITNQTSEAITQRVMASKTAEVGFGSNYYELYHLEYGAAWRITPALTLDPTAFIEYYKTSDQNATFGEKAWRFGVAVGARYALSPSLTLGADYRFVLKNSNAPSSDYRQNVALLSLYYNF